MEPSGSVIECLYQERGVMRDSVVSFSKTYKSLLSTGSTQEDRSRHNWKIVDWDVKNQIKQTNQPGREYSLVSKLNQISALKILSH